MRASPTTTIGSVISASLRFSNAQRVATSALTRAPGNCPLPYHEADDHQAPVACRWHVTKWPIETFAAVAQGRSVSEESRHRRRFMSTRPREFGGKNHLRINVVTPAGFAQSWVVQVRR